MKLLIVDDHVLFREGLAAIVRPERDIEVVGLAGTVREAVELAGTLQPDIILMDYNLTDGTGAEATRLILAKNPKCKIVFLTIYEDDESLFAAIRSGAKGFLLKNIHPSKLAPTLRAVQNGESALSRAFTLRLMEEMSHTRETRQAPDAALSELTNRELEILRSLSSGMSNQEIAEQRYLSVNTVKYHVHSILTKLGLSDRKEAAEFAREHGLLK